MINVYPKRLFTPRQLITFEKVSRPIVRTSGSDHLRIVAFSDYRVQDIPFLLDFIRSLCPQPDLLLYGGDDVERFQADGQNYFEQLAATATYGLCAVIGNDGAPFPEESEPTESVRVVQPAKEVIRTRAYITGSNVFNVHSTPVIIGKHAVIGVEGSVPDKQYGILGIAIYPEASVARHLRLAANAVKGKQLIVVSHTPPKGALDAAIRFGVRPIGSVSLRKFIVGRRDVPLVVCGHVHSCGEQSVRLGRSTVVNAASHDDYGAPGRVAVIEVSAGQVINVTWHVLWELCSVAGIKDGRKARLQAAGVSNIEHLANTTPQQIAKALKSSMLEAASIRARAESLITQDVVHHAQLCLPAGDRVYLDIETDLLSKFVWLIGLHAESEAKTYSFYANTPRDEKRILTEMLRWLDCRQNAYLVSYSGCTFEKRLLTARLAAHSLPTEMPERIKDVYCDIHNCVAFPTQGLTLKEVAKWCGFKWRDGGMDGFGAALRYGTKGRLSKAEKQKAIRYNEDDLLALKHVVHFLQNGTHLPASSSKKQLSVFAAPAT